MVASKPRLTGEVRLASRIDRWHSLPVRLPLLIFAFALACSDCAQAWPFGLFEGGRKGNEQQGKSPLFRLPWNSRTKEQARLNAATTPKPASREEELMKPDITKEFNPAAANFGAARSINGKSASTGAFQFENKTRTKSFATRGFATKEASGSQSQFATKTAATKESWYSKLTAPTKTYATRESRDANRGLQGATLPGSDQKFQARGRRQAELDAQRAKGRAPLVPLGWDRDVGQSWNGDLKPLSIQDVKTLLNKN